MSVAIEEWRYKRNLDGSSGYDFRVWWLTRMGRQRVCTVSSGVCRKMRRLPAVDADQLAVCGHSLGAKPVLMLGLLEPAVRAVVWNDHASNWREQIRHTKLQPLPAWHFDNDACGP